MAFLGRGLFQIFLEPVCHLLQAADAVPRSAAAAQLMVFPVKQAKARLYPVELEGGEHLEPFGHPAAEILVRMEKKGRGFYLARRI